MAVLDLIARGDARVLQSGDHVTISLPGGQTIASYPIEELGTSVAALERGRSGVSIVWTSDLDGGSFEPSPHASGGGALVDSSGDLVGMDTATLEWLSRFVAVADARWSSERPKTKSDGVAVDRGVLFMSDAVVPRLHALSAEFDLILDFDVAAGIHEGVTADPFSTGLILPIVASKPAGVVMVGAPKRSVLARGLRIEFEAAGDIMLYLDDELVGRATEVVGRSVLAMQLVAEGEIEMLGPDGDLYATVAVDEIRFPAQVVVPAGAAGVILSGRSGGFELHWFTDVFGAPTATSYDGTTAYVALGPGLGIAGSAFRATIWIGTFDD